MSMLRSSRLNRPSERFPGVPADGAGSPGTATTMPRLPASDDLTAAQELELVRRCLQRDSAAWRILYERHFGKVARLVHAVGIADGEADDLCQEIFLIVYRHLHSFRGESRLSTWIHRLSAREAIRHAKRRRVKRALLDMWKRALAPSLPRDWAENAAARRQYMMQLLARLAPERRMALVLFEIEGRPVQEIAELCGCAVNTVWTRIHRARAQLEEMAREGSA
jgi:RNA polymerase sigma-70 factor (ECF subfamily)